MPARAFVVAARTLASDRRAPPPVDHAATKRAMSATVETMPPQGAPRAGQCGSFQTSTRSPADARAGRRIRAIRSPGGGAPPRRAAVMPRGAKRRSRSRSRPRASSPAVSTSHSTAKPRLLYATARPGSNVSSQAAARSRNVRSGAPARRSSRSSGSRSGRPEVCVSRCRIRTGSRLRPVRKAGRRSATRSPSESSPRSTAARASVATTGFVSEATRNRVSAVAGSPPGVAEPVTIGGAATFPVPAQTAAAASPQRDRTSGSARAQRAGSRPASAGSVGEPQPGHGAESHTSRTRSSLAIRRTSRRSSAGSNSSTRVPRAARVRSPPSSPGSN